MSEQLYGYVRVSTKEQNLDRQILALTEYGVPLENIYQEKISGKNFDRPVYKKMVEELKPDDTLVIASVDRLGRSYEEIPEQWRIITKERKAFIVILDLPLLNTKQEKDDLTRMLLSDIALQLFSYVAQTEREFIRKRQKEGIAAAKLRGVHLGRKAMSHPEGYEEAKRAWMAGEVSARGAARTLNVSPKTFLKWMREENVSESTPSETPV